MLTMDEYKVFLNEVRTATGLGMLVPDDDGLLSVRVDDKFNLNLQFLAPSGMILCFVEVTALPKDAPGAAYRELLAAGLFGQGTAGGYFSLEPSTNIVIYNYFFNGEEAARDADGFVSTLEMILQLCEDWAGRIDDLLVSGQDARPAAQNGDLNMLA